MNILINSEKTFLCFISLIEKEFDNIKKDKVKLEKIKKILESISKNLLLPNLKKDDIEYATNLLEQLNNKNNYELTSTKKPKNK